MFLSRKNILIGLARISITPGSRRAAWFQSIKHNFPFHIYFHREWHFGQNLTIIYGCGRVTKQSKKPFLRLGICLKWLLRWRDQMVFEMILSLLFTQNTYTFTYRTINYLATNDNREKRMKTKQQKKLYPRLLFQFWF